jgi:hypothetical protein
MWGMREECEYEQSCGGYVSKGAREERWRCRWWTERKEGRKQRQPTKKKEKKGESERRTEKNEGKKTYTGTGTLGHRHKKDTWPTRPRLSSSGSFVKKQTKQKKMEF